MGRPVPLRAGSSGSLAVGMPLPSRPARSRQRQAYTSCVNRLGERVDWRDFLARPSLPPPPPEIFDALGRSPVLITGAGGSIGSGLALRLAHAALPGLVLLDSSENNLLHLQEALHAAPAARGGEITLLLGDAGDRSLLNGLFTAHQLGTVFHAAAYKHVPFLEQQPLAAIANNVFATEAVVAAAAEHGASLVLLSTDKAVEPASVMGATKSIAEEIVLARGGTVLRLGNVLDSSGSVTEVFARQIAHGEPLTVTDPAACRYFLTLDEAVNLLLLAAAQRERNAVLAPALSRQHRIAELAGFMARTLAPNCEIPIHFVGLRPGDKLAEQLWSECESVAPVGGGLLSIQPVRPDPARFALDLDALRAALSTNDLSAAVAQLCVLVPGFRPTPGVLALARNRAERAWV